MKKGRKMKGLTLDTVLIRSSNMATSSLVQWSHETMFAIVIFNIRRQLRLHTPTWAPPLDLAGGRKSPRPLVPPRR